MSEFFKQEDQVIDHVGRLPDWHIQETIQQLMFQMHNARVLNRSTFDDIEHRAPYVKAFRDELADYVWHADPNFHDEVIMAGFFVGIDSLYPEEVILENEMPVSEKGMVFIHSAFLTHHAMTNFLLDHQIGYPEFVEEPRYGMSRYGQVLTIEDIEEEADDLLVLCQHEYQNVSSNWDGLIDQIGEHLSFDYEPTYIRMGIGYASYRLNELHAEMIKTHNFRTAKRKTLEARVYLEELKDQDIVSLIKQSGDSKD